MIALFSASRYLVISLKNSLLITRYDTSPTSAVLTKQSFQDFELAGSTLPAAMKKEQIARSSHSVAPWPRARLLVRTTHYMRFGERAARTRFPETQGYVEPTRSIMKHVEVGSSTRANKCAHAKTRRRNVNSEAARNYMRLLESLSHMFF